MGQWRTHIFHRNLRNLISSHFILELNKLTNNMMSVESAVPSLTDQTTTREYCVNGVKILTTDGRHSQPTNANSQAIQANLHT
jgi:hypothetical protein